MNTPLHRFKPVCACSSYAFPHRAGSGRCNCEAAWRRHSYHLKPGDRGPDGYSIDELCASCGQPAEVKEMDFGIGAYEFWGSTGVHTDVQVVTVCCESHTVPNSWANHLALNWTVVK